VPEQERLDVLDGLRGLAILLVVWYHVWLVSGQAFGLLSLIAQAGFLGVDLFFFISGFCLFYPYARATLEGRPQPSTRRFFARRFLKIVPSYLIALFVFATIYHAQFGSSENMALQLATHLTFMHTLSPNTFGTISGPLWTVGIEVQFYLLFPLIVPWFRRSPIAGYAALIVVSETYRFAIGAAGLSPSFWWINQLPAFFDVFGAGMVAAYGLVRLRARGPLHPRTSTLLSGVAFAVAIGGLAYTSSVNATVSDDAARQWLNAHRLLIGPLCIALALPTFFAVERWRSIVATRALMFLSTISYNLYLWHLEIAVWVHNAGLPAIWTVILALPAALAVAAFVSYAFERPILEADFAQVRSALAAAATRANQSLVAASTLVPVRWRSSRRLGRVLRPAHRLAVRALVSNASSRSGSRFGSTDRTNPAERQGFARR
jgi:peptidoglycan/LPS O-acetylase OafA/YrhL